MIQFLMNRSDYVALRQTWLTIFGALSFSVLVYLLLAYFIEHSPKSRQVNSQTLATMTPIIAFLGVAMLFAAVAYIRFRVDGKIGEEGRPILLTPEQFQTQSIVAFSLSEACATFGLLLFFLGAPLQQLAYFALGTLFVNFAFILPRGLKFWRSYEKATTS